MNEEDTPSGANLIDYIQELCTLSSLPLGWKNVVVERYNRPSSGSTGELPALADHWVTLYLGSPITLAQRRDGHRHRAPLLRGDVTLTAAGHESAWAWDGPSDQLHLGITPDFLRQIAEEINVAPAGSGELRNVFTDRDPQLERIGHVLLSELETAQPGPNLFAEHLAHVLGIHLLRRYGPSSSAAGIASYRDGGLSPAHLRRCVEYIQEHLAEPLSLNDIARAVGLSPYHLSRRFKLSTGKTVHQFVADARVEYARHLILRGDLPIAQVAAESGFYDQSHLTRHVRRLLGVTPRSLLAERRKMIP